MHTYQVSEDWAEESGTDEYGNIGETQLEVAPESRCYLERIAPIEIYVRATGREHIHEEARLIKHMGGIT